MAHCEAVSDPGSKPLASSQRQNVPSSAFIGTCPSCRCSRPQWSHSPSRPQFLRLGEGDLASEEGKAREAEPHQPGEGEDTQEEQGCSQKADHQRDQEVLQPPSL